MIRVQFDIVFSLSNKRKVFFRNIYFGTALKSGPVETVPTGLVATALHSTHMYLCTDLASLKRAWLELFPTNMVCMMMRQSLTMIPGNKGGNEE